MQGGKIFYSQILSTLSLRLPAQINYPKLRRGIAMEEEISDKMRKKARERLRKLAKEGAIKV